MSRNLRGQLDTLERGQDTDAGNLPQQFWDAFCGAVPVEQLDPETHQLVESLFKRRPSVDPIEARLAQEEAKTRLPNGLKELPAPPLNRLENKPYRNGDGQE